ncbi:MAG: hypothetical protein ACWGPN_10660, partial [Gammaproteobacteria bacterium]
TRRPAVKTKLAQYTNEIVSITIMLLMAIALIAGPATPARTGADDGSDRAVYQAVRVPGDE